MRAVNLIPTDQQRGAGGAAGRSGGGAYILLGALALLVVMAGAYVLAGKKVDDKRAEVARVTQEATAAEAKAQSLTSFTKFSALRVKRVDTVTQLAASRFDWSQALREVARVLPANAWLTTMNGSTSPSAGGGSGLRAALQVPAIEITGCTTSQASVAKMMARMRLIDGVQQVSLSSSDKGADTTAPAGGGATGDCRNGHSHFPMFSIVVFYNATSGVPASTTSAAATTSSTASSTTPSSTTPAGTTASSTTPAPTSTTAATGGTTP
jgi:Tfp pilus assembly protein PilN